MPAAVVPASTSIHSNPPNTLVMPQKCVLVFRFLFLCLLLVSCNCASSSLDPWFLSSCFLSCWCEAAICARWYRRFVTWLRVAACCSHQQPPKQEHTERWNTPERLRRPQTSFVCYLIIIYRFFCVKYWLIYYSLRMGAMLQAFYVFPQRSHYSDHFTVSLIVCAYLCFWVLIPRKLWLGTIHSSCSVTHEARNIQIVGSRMTRMLYILHCG